MFCDSLGSQNPVLAPPLDQRKMCMSMCPLRVCFSHSVSTGVTRQGHALLCERSSAPIKMAILALLGVFSPLGSHPCLYKWHLHVLKQVRFSPASAPVQQRQTPGASSQGMCCPHPLTGELTIQVSYLFRSNTCCNHLHLQPTFVHVMYMRPQ